MNVKFILKAISLGLLSSLALASNGQCGKKNGNAVCPSGECCSKYGYCGKSEKYCGDGCQSEFGKCSSNTTTTLPISTNGKCGAKYGKCPSGECCSKYGYCGRSSDHCGKNCQSEYGQCSGSKSTSTTTTTKTKTTSKKTCPTGTGSYIYRPTCDSKKGKFYYRNHRSETECEGDYVCFLPCDSSKSKNSVTIEGKNYCSCDINKSTTSDLKKCESEASKYGYVKENDNEKNDNCTPVTVTKKETITKKEKETVTVKETVTEKVTVTVTVASTNK